MNVKFVYFQHVQMLIHSALQVYSADKTGMVDYALESAGNVRTEGFTCHGAVYPPIFPFNSFYKLVIAAVTSC